MSRIARLNLTSHDPQTTARFYCDAFGFERVGAEERDGEAFGVPGARVEVLALRLGAQEIELVALSPPGPAYPADSRSYDLWFQHFAIVVVGMRHVYRRLAALDGWSAISAGGPVTLPQASGGVTAFKFRDPEGHPLELLEFPDGAVPAHWQSVTGSGCIGIDHTAIAVSDTEASVTFYRGLGFEVAGGSLNRGSEQERLDDAPGAVVEVTALNLARVPPHLELLCYRTPRGRRAARISAHNVAKTRLVLETGSAERAGIVPDPDGHELMLRRRS